MTTTQKRRSPTKMLRLDAGGTYWLALEAHDIEQARDFEGVTPREERQLQMKRSEREKVWSLLRCAMAQGFYEFEEARAKEHPMAANCEQDDEDNPF